ncbi:MAG TPA: hypothetical protein VGF85_00665 [Opitutaceae bacterium]|jgi:hypothetical protein
MRERALAALLTAVVFAIGFGAGVWEDRHQPFPRPPGGMLGEFAIGHGPPGHAPQPVNRAQLIEQIDSIRPQMEAFRARITEIYSEFDRDVDTVLTSNQKEIYERRFRSQRSFAPSHPPPPENDRPLSDEQIEQLLQRPFRSLAFLVVVPMTLDRMSTELNLEDAQRQKVKDLLRVRREKFIELVDGSPPLSLMLSRLAPIAQRLSGPGKAPPALKH